MSDLSLDEALNKVGTGRFQWRMLAICGLSNAADAVEVMCVGLVATAAEQEMALTSERAGILNASTLFGMFFGALVWGMISDTMGRRRALLLALLLNFSFALLSSTVWSFWQLGMLRMLAGVGVGGSIPVVFAQMSESCETCVRGKFLVMCASCWMFGSMYSAGMGWLIIPSAGWRVFVLVAALPAGACLALGHCLLTESPRFLLTKGRTAEALQVLRLMAAHNGVDLPEDFRVALVDSGSSKASTAEQEDLQEYHDMCIRRWGCGPGTSAGSSVVAAWRCRGVAAAAHLMTAGRSAAHTLSVLLLGPLRRYTLPLMVGWIGLCGGWYSLVLWLPRYFQMRGADGASMYMDTFIVSVANFPGNVACVWLVDALGRRVTACACMAAGCICAVLFAAAPATGHWPLVAACVFNMVSVGGWNSLDLISTELYPTAVRSSGFGLLNGTGRISSFVCTYLAGHLLSLSAWAPLVLSAALLAMGSAAMLLLPESAGKPLEDAVQHAGAIDDCTPVDAAGGGPAAVSRGRSSRKLGGGADLERVGLLAEQNDS